MSASSPSAPVAVRIAPSPTGLLHIGNIRAALFNFLFARRHGGNFMLRLDDTDRERSRDEFAQAIERDLGWLGLKWDRFARQSDRLAKYDAALEQLKTAGRAYACFETPEELGLKRKTQLARGLPPVYDRAALKLTDAERAALIAQGRKPHWRFKLEGDAVAWNDLVQGAKNFPVAALSDPVLVREDGVPLYTFSSVVDDVEFAITHVMRGEDHVTNTAVQIQIWQALSQAPAPTFAHFPLIVSASGIEMSKRLGTLSIASLRDPSTPKASADKGAGPSEALAKGGDGIEAMAINSLLARLGTSAAIAPVLSLEELARDFDVSKISHSTPKFDIEELKALNAKILHLMPFAAVRERLPQLGLGEADENFWNAVRANLEKLGDAKTWWTVVRGPLAPSITDHDFIAAAAGVLPPAPWDENTWGVWTNAVKEKTGRKGKDLFMPLRVALTGADHGPEMKLLLPLIGPERVKARLAGKTA